MRQVLCSALFLIFLVSCSKGEPEDSSLEGKWVLTDVACFCGFGEDYDFSTSMIEFDTAKNKITIENNGEYQFLRESGTYNYSGKDNTIKFDNGGSYIFEIDSANLRIVLEDDPNIADDEITFYYKR